MMESPTARAGIMVAQAGRPGLSDVVGPVTLLLGVLALGVVLLAYMHFRRRTMPRDDGSASYFSSFREMRERGELSEEEFQKIRAAMSRKIRATMSQSPPIEIEPIKPPANPPRSLPEKIEPVEEDDEDSSGA